MVAKEQVHSHALLLMHHESSNPDTGSMRWRQVKDIKGRVFGLAVNPEHKATECSPNTACMIREPHMWTFWAATIGFFCTFFSCFAPSSLGEYYGASKSMGGLGLTGLEKSNANAFAVTGTIVARVLAGPMCAPAPSDTSVRLSPQRTPH